MANFQKHMWPLVKLLLAALPIGWVAYRVDINEIAVKFSSISSITLLVFCFVIFGRILLQTIRFHRLTKIYTSSIGFAELFALDMKARYYSTILPSSVGQDIIRGAFLRRHMSSDQIIGISLFFRITGVAPLLILSFVGLIFLADNTILGRFAPAVAIITTAFAVTAALFFSKGATHQVATIFTRFTPEKYALLIKRSMASLQSFRNQPGIAAETILISLFSQCLIIFNSAILIKAITSSWHSVEVTIFVPLIELLATVIPFGPNGLGVREGLSALFFSFLGRPNEEMVIYITISSLGHLMNLTGIVVLLADHFRKPNQRDPARAEEPTQARNSESK